MSSSVTRTIQKFGLEQAFHYLYKDPDKNMLKIMDWADKFAGRSVCQPTEDDQGGNDQSGPSILWIYPSRPQRHRSKCDENHCGQLFYQCGISRLAEAGRTPEKVWLQHSVDHSAGSYQCL